MAWFAVGTIYVGIALSFESKAQTPEALRLHDCKLFATAPAGVDAGERELLN